MVTITGPESTGKSTLATALAGQYGAERSAEAARGYAHARAASLPPGTPPSDLLGRDDVEPIARAQLALEEEAAARAAATGRALVVRDTDLVSTVVYARQYYGACPTWVVDAARRRRADAYLLCDVDLPWVADEQRDRPRGRAELREAFARALDEFGCEWTLIRGHGAARDHAARLVIDALLARRAFASSGVRKR